MSVVVETTVGDFTVDLYTKERPQTCRNFLKLCKIKYYNWNLFFTVQSNFIAQTGDPTSTGKGGKSIYGIVLGEKACYYEAEQIPKIKHDKAGLISMVNCGDNMLASQFFITLGSDLQSLDGDHCVFGEITEGLEIILKFNETICDVDHRPYQDIRISHTVVLEDPYEDPKGLVIPDRSPEPTKEALMSDRIGADETIDDTVGMSIEEITEMQKEKEAKARATILEIVGDIPDAEMAPPENVLFVCKLNPVTNDDDLEIIFSRFGKIVGCEVIRDRQTGDSLQYAFIEFAERKSCEEAYFKMDNVLIDDRRIHVDFSQSVAKMRWRGKGKGIKYFDEENEHKNKKKEKLRDGNKIKHERSQSGSESPKRERGYYWDKDKHEFSQRDIKKMQKFNKNGDEQKRNDKDSQFIRKRQSDGRSKSKEKVKERKEKSRERKERSRERRERSKERKERSRERKEKSRDRSRDRSKEGKDRKERNSQYEYKNRENYYRDPRIKVEKYKKKEHDRKSSEDQDDRHSNNKKSKRPKSKDESEEKHERSGHKHKHKYKSR